MYFVVVIFKYLLFVYSPVVYVIVTIGCVYLDRIFRRHSLLYAQGLSLGKGIFGKGGTIWPWS